MKNITTFLKTLPIVEKFAVILLLIFGLGIVFALPPGAGFDEETHLMRVWEMSDFYLIPNEQLGNDVLFPKIFWDMSYRQRLILEPLSLAFFDEFSGQAIDSRDYLYGSDFKTRSVYSPVLLLPQALVMRLLGRSLNWTVLPVYYAIRIVGLLAYLGFIWLSIRIIPFGKWVFAVVALSPMAVLQAATISADPISNGIAFLFIAGVLSLVDYEKITTRRLIAIIILIALLFSAKLNFVVLILLLFLMLKPSQVGLKRYAFLVLVTLILAAIEVGGWNIIAYSKLETIPLGTSPMQQLHFIFTQPMQFGLVIIKDLFLNGADYLKGWIGVYGYNYWTVPGIVYWVYFAAIIFILLSKNNKRKLETRQRIFLIGVFVASYLFTALSLYLKDTPVGGSTVFGVQGRYFTPIAVLLGLAFCNLPGLLYSRRFTFWGSLMLTLGLGIYVAGLVLSYYVPCGSQFYNRGLCYQPVYKNWAPNDRYSSPVSIDHELRQEFIVKCNGFAEVRVWADGTNSAPDGQVRFSLYAGGDKSNLIAEWFIPNQDLPSGGWQYMSVQPDWKSDGKRYFLTIMGDRPSGPKFAYTLKPEYMDGKLFENDTAIDSDLVFTYGCIAGLDKLLTP